VGLALILFFSMTAYAQETEENDAVLNERIELIQASQRISEEQKKDAALRSGISLYVTNYHTDQTEYKLGGKFEQPLFSNENPQELNNIALAYVIEGIYLESEATSIAGFLSLKATFNNRMFSPYIGAGAEFMGVANYQAFVGLNIIDSNFFVETKFINDQDEWDSGSFYSVAGFKIDL
jgi:hypothetical protein